MILYRTSPHWTQKVENRGNADERTYQHAQDCLKPATNIVERDDDFVLNMALPGYTKKDIIIDIDQDVLKISSELTMHQQDKDSVLKQEFSIQPFARRFQLPDSVETDKISASFKNGVLSITAPKKEYAKARPPREIAIA
jgi:HSP20 family protein